MEQTIILKLPKWIKEGVNFRNVQTGVRIKVIKIDDEKQNVHLTAFRAGKIGGAHKENNFVLTFKGLINLENNKLIQQM